jgi:hypothetical protein
LLKSHGLVIASQAVMHVCPTTESKILGQFSGCKDRVLAFRHMTGSFTSFTDKVKQAAFIDWLSTGITPTRVLNTLIDRIYKNIQGPLACVVVSRGDVEDDCGKDIQRLKDPTFEQKLIYFRSCNASPERILEYTVADATKLKIELKSIYILDEIPLPGELKAKQGKRSLSVYTRNDLKSLLYNIEEISDLPIAVQSSLASLVGQEICRRSAFFLGNIYSTVSNRIQQSRDPSLSSFYLGHTW